jgi:deoxyribodipyrimidine photolyase
VGELRDIGYLHNHARLWFASIWVFTLRLPWQLCANFFLRYLLDGAPASNTCSWRDAAIWPHAAGGFLVVKRLRSLLRGLGHPG